MRRLYTRKKHPCIRENSVRVLRLYDQNHPRSDFSLCDQGRGGGALVPPGGGEGTDGLVVAGEAVDTGLDENETATSISPAQYAAVFGIRTTCRPCPCGWSEGACGQQQPS